MDHNPNYSTDGNEDSETADQNVDGKQLNEKNFKKSCKD